MMVAYTSPDCLPYFECTDSPCLNTGTTCEPSTVWCDLTALLEPRLNAFDDIRARTATAVPFAKVARFAQQFINVSVVNYDSLIQFDTVLADNDNMVDLDTDNRYVVIHRPGIYHYEVYMAGFPPPVVDNGFATRLSQGTGSSFASSETMWRSGVVYNRLAFTRNITQASIDAFGGFNMGVTADLYTGSLGSGIVTVNYCEMTVYWVADL